MCLYSRLSVSRDFDRRIDGVDVRHATVRGSSETGILPERKADNFGSDGVELDLRQT